MVWQFYTIIFVLVIWLLHGVVNLGINKIKELQAYYNETKIPLVFDEVWVRSELLKLSYINTSDKKIVGFDMIIEIEGEDGKIELVGFYVDKLKQPIKSYGSKKMMLELSLTNETEKIINAYPVKVTFLDGSVWQIKNVNK